MKNVLKSTAFLLLLSIVFISCNKNDDNVEFTALKSISYDPAKIDATVEKAFKGTDSKVSPSDVSVTFTITKVTKDGTVFTNPDKGFKIDTKGMVYAEEGHELKAGEYDLTIEAVDRHNKENKKAATFKVNINAAEAKTYKSFSPKTEDNVYVITIAPFEVDCVGVGPQKCMLIKGEGQSDWEYFYDQIEGFIFEEGHEYVLEVKTEDVPNPPADAFSIRYILIRQISKVKSSS